MNDVISHLLAVYYLYLILTAIYLLLDNREPSSTISWLIVFIVFPVFGFILYIFIGQSWRRSPRNEHHFQQFIDGHLLKSLKPLIDKQPGKLAGLKSRWSSANKRELMQLLFNVSNSLLTMENSVRIFHHGKDKFEALCQDLKGASQFIHMEYFILRHDELGEKIKGILIERAQKGVKVRILYDSIGSLFISGRYLRQLRQAGVEIFPFFNFLSLFKIHTLNYRNHRKAVIIDGKIGYNGGMNIGKEYIDGGRYHYWRDTHIRIVGEAVAIYQSIFAIDWYNTTKQEEIFDGKYFELDHVHEPTVPIQVTTSGPDSQWASIKQLYFALIQAAEKRIYIQTPYFIPDASIYMALKTAALSGLQVKIMVTGVVDHWLPYWSAFTYFDELLEAGVEVYHYKKGLMHAKTVSIDGQVCTIGTANLDVRSFHLNYETNTLIYDERCAMEIEAQFDIDARDSKPFTKEDLAKLGTAKKLRNSLARLFAPLL